MISSFVGGKKVIELKRQVQSVGRAFNLPTCQVLSGRVEMLSWSSSLCLEPFPGIKMMQLT